MVFAFLCHSLTSSPCRLLYSIVYGEDMQTGIRQGVPADGLRKLRKDQLMEVACRVQSEYGFRCEAKDRVRVPKGLSLKDETGTSSEGIPNYEKGYFRLSANDPFSTIKSVLWMVSDGCAFVFILDQEENRILAEVVLSLITRLSHDYCLTLEQRVAEVLLKSEKISTIIQTVLPNGQLVFMNHKLIKQFEKQIETILTK